MSAPRRPRRFGRHAAVALLALASLAAAAAGVALIQADAPEAYARVQGALDAVVPDRDLQEMRAAVLRLGLMFAATGAGFVAGVAVTLLLWWRQRRAREFEQRLAFLSRNGNDAIFLIDAGGRVVDANARALALYRYAREDLVGRPYAELSVEGEALLDLELEGGLLREASQRCRDGHVFPAEVSASRIELDGRRHFQAIVRDISERKRNEQRLVLYARVLESNPNATFIADAQRNIRWANPAFTAITGYSVEEAIGRNPRMLSSGRQTPAFYAAMWGQIRQLGFWEGEIWNRRKNGDIYPEWLTIGTVQDGHGATTHYFAIFADISERKQSEERIRQLAQYDSLTSLPNRALLQDRLTHALATAARGGAMLCVMFLDLDRFKQVNDSLGHLAGDLLLREVGRRLSACIRESDTVGRLGGDEFVVVLADVRDEKTVVVVAEKIRAALRAPHVIEGERIVATPSIGIALYPRDGLDPTDLLKAADLAMYHAKQQGRDGFRFYSADMWAAA